MKKRWFVVILTIGLLLRVLPLSVLALSPDPITNADGTLLDWSDLSTVSDSLDDLQEQRLAVVDAKPGTAAAPGLSEAGPENPPPLADADRDKAAADDRNLTPKTPDEETDDDAPADDTGSTGSTGSTTPPAVCKIGDSSYSTLDEAIQMAVKGDQIDLLTDIEWDAGLRFENKKLTISGGNTYTLTLEQYGMYAYKSDITFQDLTLTISAITHTYEGGAGGTANLISNSDLHLNNVDFTLTPEGSCGSGMYLYQQSNLYLDGSRVLISGNMVDGIFADESEYVGMPNREVKIMNGSYVEARGCSHAGILLDPIDITMSSSEVFVTGNGVGYSFGFSCYDGKLTMESSILRADDNAHAWSGSGIYVGALDMDAASTIYATDNGGSGLTIGAADGKEKSYIRGQIYCEGNGTSGIGGGGGFVVHAQHDYYEDEDKWYIYEGDVTLEPGAYIYACNNKALAGVLNNWILNIESGATVIADNNEQFGFGNTYDARTTIESGADVSINNNLHGLYNYAGDGNTEWAKGFFLIEGGAHVTVNNNKLYGIYTSGGSDTPDNDYFTIQGGADVSADGNGAHGIYNDGGIFTVETGAIVSACNNGYYGIFNNKGTFTVENGVDLQVEYNKESGVVNVENSKLTLLSGCVRYNTTKNFYGYGGGLRNYGEATLSDDVQLYNNHARLAGDDIENGNGATITFGPTGSGWELDGGPDCYDFIDGWYDDYETTRWNAHEEDEAKLHMVLVAPVTSYTGPLSLKAAHGSLSTGSLTVRKETVGELLPSDYDTAFTFELTLEDDTITTIDDQWCGVPFKNGKASFTLKSGESITLSNLPAGIGYTITEAAQDDWTLLNINDAETGVVPRNDTAEVVFTNLKNNLDIPDVPVVPIEPEEPEIPEETEETETPEEPEGPEIPQEPEEPEIPEETEETEAPGELPAEEPAQTDTSASLAQPEETPTQNTTTVTLIQTGTTDWLAAVLLIFGIGLLACGWFFDRKQRAAKH